MAAETSLQELLDSLPKISEKRRYWFVRTNAGEYYDAFKKGNYIAIGYNDITLEAIKKANTGDETGIKILAEAISKKYTKEQEYRPGYSASQLLKFVYEIKKGDIVLIPSENSTEISFGEVKETPVYLESKIAQGDSDYYKRKKVKWLYTIDREDLDPNLYRLMYSHHTVTDAGEYSEYIDKIINSFYIKGGKANLVLNVETVDDIKAKDLFQLGSIALDLVDEFCEEESLPYSSDGINLKLDVQSPGFILLAGVTMPAVILVGIIFIAVAGGGFAFTYKKDVKTDIKTDGLVEKMRAFLNSKSNRRTKKELLEKHMKELQIKDPEDLVKILKELNK